MRSIEVIKRENKPVVEFKTKDMHGEYYQDGNGNIEVDNQYCYAYSSGTGTITEHILEMKYKVKLLNKAIEKLKSIKKTVKFRR